MTEGVPVTLTLPPSRAGGRSGHQDAAVRSGGTGHSDRGERRLPLFPGRSGQGHRQLHHRLRRPSGQPRPGAPRARLRGGSRRPPRRTARPTGRSCRSWTPASPDRTGLGMFRGRGRRRRGERAYRWTGRRARASWTIQRGWVCHSSASERSSCSSITTWRPEGSRDDGLDHGPPALRRPGATRSWSSCCPTRSWTAGQADARHAGARWRRR